MSKKKDTHPLHELAPRIMRGMRYWGRWFESPYHKLFQHTANVGAKYVSAGRASAFSEKLEVALAEDLLSEDEMNYIYNTAMLAGIHRDPRCEP